MEVPKQYNSFEYVCNIEWNDIFAVWRAGESYQEGWKSHWLERGFDSWDAWRGNYVAPIFPENKNWKIYRIKNLDEIREIYGTPSRGWIEKCYDGEITKKIGDILEYPIIKNNDKIQAILKNFPYQTMLTGVINDGRIVLIEGMHRTCALAIMAENKIEHNGDVMIALAEHEGEIPRIGKGNNN